jgi:hypothetical protein
MDFGERFVCAILGVIWGAVLGVVVVLAAGAVISTWRTSFRFYTFAVVSGPSIVGGVALLCAAAGFLFKTSTATAIGNVLSWAWDIVWNLENPWSRFIPWRVIWVALAGLAYLFLDDLGIWH